ncbi:MAG: C39 family peptidase [Lachnospiraceae bacterium]|nr:C39 family peptidase [Lachnospiraceae bacterium]
MLFLAVGAYAVGAYMQSGTPKKYVITTDNYFDYQSAYECSGYSVAYVLRCMGEEADGLTIYQSIPYKNDDGTVTPGNLIKFLEESGYNVTLCSGTIAQIKEEVSKGVPVIAFVRTSPKVNYYHYLPIVGYDEEHIYAADSLHGYVNTDSQYYNRVLSEEDFEAMLDTGVYWKNAYIVFEQE